MSNTNRRYSPSVVAELCEKLDTLNEFHTAITETQNLVENKIIDRLTTKLAISKNMPFLRKFPLFFTPKEIEHMALVYEKAFEKSIEGKRRGIGCATKVGVGCVVPITAILLFSILVNSVSASTTKKPESETVTSSYSYSGEIDDARVKLIYGICEGLDTIWGWGCNAVGYVGDVFETFIESIRADESAEVVLQNCGLLAFNSFEDKDLIIIATCPEDYYNSLGLCVHNEQSLAQVYTMNKVLKKIDKEAGDIFIRGVSYIAEGGVIKFYESWEEFYYLNGFENEKEFKKYAQGIIRDTDGYIFVDALSSSYVR